MFSFLGEWIENVADDIVDFFTDCGKGQIKNHMLGAVLIFWGILFSVLLSV